MPKILYIDMDNVLVDFPSSFRKIDPKLHEEYKDKMDEVPGIFSHMDPIEDAIESYKKLSGHFVTYILSTSPWENPSAWSDKLNWIKKYLSEPAKKRLILSHHKHLNIGDFLVDDREKNGAIDFKGELILFGSAKFPDWKVVTAYLMERR